VETTAAVMAQAAAVAEAMTAVTITNTVRKDSNSKFCKEANS
jgi:hypothetical protein